MPLNRTLIRASLCGLAAFAYGQTGRSYELSQLAPSPSSAGSTTGPSLPWDEAFPDRSGPRPLHFVARYLDGQSHTHRLEEWRTGLAHLRRRTDDRIDLHADATTQRRPGQPVDYLWQILDLAQKINHRVSSQGMLRAGMLYSFYSMAHVLTRPPGNFEVHEVQGLPPASIKRIPARWFEITTSGQPATRVCWLPALGIPLRTQVETKEGWRTTFQLEQLDTHAVSPAIFAVNAKGFQIRNVEELEVDD